MTEIIKGMTMEAYKARPGINASLLKCVHLFSLKHARAQLDGKCEKSTDAQDFGTCFHSLVLEGRQDYAIHPDTYPAPKDHEKVKKKTISEGDPLPWNWNANACKGWAASYLSAGIKIVSSDEDTELKAMVESVRSEDDIAPYLEGDTEVSVFAEYEGLPVKARVDLLPFNQDAPVIDFKKGVSSNPDKFTKTQVVDYGAHLQAAWNIDVLRWAGVKRDAFWLVGIEQKYPHATCIVKFNDQPVSFLRVGRRNCRAVFHKIVEAQNSGRWPAYGASFAEEWAKPWQLPELETT